MVVPVAADVAVAVLRSKGFFKDLTTFSDVRRDFGAKEIRPKANLSQQARSECFCGFLKALLGSFATEVSQETSIRLYSFYNVQILNKIRQLHFDGDFAIKIPRRHRDSNP